MIVLDRITFHIHAFILRKLICGLKFMKELEYFMIVLNLRNLESFLCIHINTHTHTHTHTYIYIYIYIYTHTHIYIYIYIYTHTQIYIHTQTNTHTHTPKVMHLVVLHLKMTQAREEHIRNKY
jgi:hypothetical protein